MTPVYSINDKQTLFICSKANRRWHSLIFPDTSPAKRFESGKIDGINLWKRIIALDDWQIVAVMYALEPGLFSQHGRKMKQLFIPAMSLDDFKKYVKHLPRLERLHLSSNIDCEPSERYDGPQPERLEILEISDVRYPFFPISI